MIVMRHNLSDHFPQFLIVNDLKIDYKSAIHFVYEYNKIDVNTFLMDYSSLDWSDLDNNELSCNSKFDIFLNKTIDFISRKVPCHKLSKKQLKFPTKPWINKDIQKKIKYRDKLFRQVTKSGNTQTRHLYKTFRNRIVKKIRNSKQKYYLNYFNQNRSTWPEIGDMRYRACAKNSLQNGYQSLMFNV